MLDKKKLFEFVADKPDEKIFSRIKEHWDHVSKPIDGLGDFEDVLCRIGAVQGNVSPAVQNRCCLIFCADNGIVGRGVSQSGKEITGAVAAALGRGISSACHLGKYAKVRVVPVDIGIDCAESIEGVLDRKVAKGTKDFLSEPAMTEAEVLKAIETGISQVKEQKDLGTDIIATGEMGIGNTSTSAACLSALLNLDASAVTGKGAGLDDEGLKRKIDIIEQAIQKYGFCSSAVKGNGTGSCYGLSLCDDICDRKRAFEILRCLGGLDIAALVGVFIGGAIYHVPIVIDGVITSTAACFAKVFVPGTEDYMIASHKGREKGNETALRFLGLKPLLGGDMALGEGTGAIMLFPLLDMVTDFYMNGAKFSDYEIDEYKRFEG